MASARKFTDPGNESQHNSDPLAEPIDADTAVIEGQEVAQTSSAEATAHLHGEIDRLKAERDQSVDRLARLQAEFENARKREARERTDFRDFAVSGAVEQFLPVLDNFQLALGRPARSISFAQGSNSSSNKWKRCCGRST